MPEMPEWLAALLLYGGLGLPGIALCLINSYVFIYEAIQQHRLPPYRDFREQRFSGTHLFNWLLLAVAVTTLFFFILGSHRYFALLYGFISIASAVCVYILNNHIYLAYYIPEEQQPQAPPPTDISDIAKRLVEEKRRKT